MLSFDLIFISILNEDIVEDEGALWDEKRISWLPINIVSYQGKRVQFVYGSFCTCVIASLGGGVSSGADFRESGCFFEFFNNIKLKNQKTGLHADIHFSCDQKFGLPISLDIPVSVNLMKINNM